MKPLRAEAAPAALTLARRGSGRLADFISLAKPRLNLLVVASSAAGYYLGASGPLAAGAMIRAVCGTALVAGGAAALNQLYERDTDALMIRTRLRPLPDGRVTPEDARTFGVGLALAGVTLLALESVVSAILAVATLIIYLALYTPLKRRSSISTLVGALPGALPPLIGWAAASGGTSAGGWALFAIVFLWQIPHFMAIAWLYRIDYGRAGFPMLPVVDPDGHRTGRQAVLYSALLLPASLVPAWVGVAGTTYVVLAVVLGVGLIGLSLRFAHRRNDRSARALFYGSITYLPLIWAAMIMSRP